MISVCFINYDISSVYITALYLLGQDGVDVVASLNCENYIFNGKYILSSGVRSHYEIYLLVYIFC